MSCVCCNNNYKKKSIEEKIQDRINSLHGDDVRCDCDEVRSCGDACECGCGEVSECGNAITVLDWIKEVATAEEIVDFFSQSCSDGDKDMWCEGFESCRDCKVSWLKSKWLG